MKFLLNDLLFNHAGTNIPISKDGKSITGKVGPTDVGLSKHHNGRTKKATLSCLALCLSGIFIDYAPLLQYSNDYNTIIGIVNNHKFYYNLLTKEFVFDDDENRLHGPQKLLPFVAFQYVNDVEFKDNYLLAEAQFQSVGYVDPEVLLRLCDNFYFSLAKGYPEIDVSFDFDKNFFENCLFSSSSFAPLPTTLSHNADNITPSAPIPNTSNTVLENAINGQYLIPYEWNEDQKTRISRNKVLSTFISTESFEDILLYCHGSLSNIKARLDAGLIGADAIGDDILNLTLFGDPSGGKTTIANALGEALGLPVYTISQSKFSEEDTYWGKTAVVDGGFKTVATPFLDCFTNGGIAVLEEVNLVDPGVTMGALGNAIWSPFLLMKDGYEPITRHPMCIVIGTKNIGTFGSRDVNEAFNNRFVQSFEIEEPTKKQFIEFLNIHEPNKKVCEWVYEAYSRICKYLKSPTVNAEDILKNISFRSCLGVLKAIQYGQTPKRALKNSITGKIAEIDKELGHKVYDDVVLSLTDLRR